MTTEKIMTMSQEEVLNIALTAGKILLTSGAETYRVEDTIIRLCAWRKMGYVKVFVTPTFIIVGDEKAHGFTFMTRVMARTTNLSLISAVSDMSYTFGNWSLGYEETKLYLEELRKRPTPSKYVTSVASGTVAACFAVMLGGSFADFGAAFLTGFAAMLAVKQLAVLRITSFWENALAGMIIAFVALTCCQLNSDCTQEKIIVGGIMPFLPGVAFTNGLRDFMAGDLLSGNSRIAEAFLFAASLAVGIAVVLRIWLA